MSRATWIALSLLVVTNAVWAAAWFGQGDESESVFGVEEAYVAKLKERVEELRTRAETAEQRAGPGGGALEPAEGVTGTDDPVAVEEPEAKRLAEAAKAKQAQAQAQKDAERAKAYAAARKQVMATLHKAMQVEDAALRAEGVAEIAAALGGDDPYVVEYMLGGLWTMKELDIDRAYFARLVEAHLDSENPGIRRSSLYAMYAMDPENPDLRLALASATDTADTVRHHAGRLIALYTGKKLEGEAAEAMAELLADENVNVRRGTVRGLTGAKLTPEIEDRLIEMAKRPAERHDAVYFGLSTVDNKSRKVVDTLFTYLTDENHNTRGRAHWGLQRGVPKAEQPYVARRYAEHLTKFVNPKSHQQALQLIAKYGDDSVVPKLEQFAANEMVDPKVRALAERAADYVRKKKPDR